MTEASNTQTETDTLAENSDRLMVEQLENTLAEHLEKLRDYDIDGAMPLAEEASRLSQAISIAGILDRAEFADERKRIDESYAEIGLVIAGKRQEVSDKLEEIREGIETLSASIDNQG
ncbi:MAG: hypothetical protein DRP66_11305 [Planctomycetota bacterium]|nr:MAG: hypothetical protein DRP66_11305 [Planctomycetota bacterium]